MIEAVSGDGRVLRPMIINKWKVHYMGWYAKLKEKDLATFRVSEKGWSNEALGLCWLKEVFDKETRARQVFLQPFIYYIYQLIVSLFSNGNEYRLLILDGHTSHYNWQLFD